MNSHRITGIQAEDRRFALDSGAGSDAVHTVTEYAFAVTKLKSDNGLCGVGIVLTLGEGIEIICRLITALSELLPKLPIEEVMADFGAISRKVSNQASLRWLGPHKSAVHLALASITNACFDLWAKSRGVPLWRLLFDLTPQQLLNALDLSYLEEDLPAELVIRIMDDQLPGRPLREKILTQGYPGYDTSVGWFQYEDHQLREKAKRALGSGFRALKLKVGSQDSNRDVRRAARSNQAPPSPRKSPLWYHQR